MPQLTPRARFEAALEGLIDDIKRDRNILAAILCGSLAHDEVWDRSDIDLVLVSTDIKRSIGSGVALVADDINIHTQIVSRGEFSKSLESSIRNTFAHALYAKAKLLYSTDPSIDRLFEEILDLGQRDRQLQQMRAAIGALTSLYKAHKWFRVRGDLDLTALWILYTADSLAQMELGRHGRIVGREVLPEALELNPAPFNTIYTELLNRKKTRKAVAGALEAIDAYLETRMEDVCSPLLDYLESSGEPRSVTEISHHFRSNFQLEHTVILCEWLADVGVVDKVSMPVKLTSRSKVDVEELAFFYLGRA